MHLTHILSESLQITYKRIQWEHIEVSGNIVLPNMQNTHSIGQQ